MPSRSKKVCPFTTRVDADRSPTARLADIESSEATVLMARCADAAFADSKRIDRWSAAAAGDGAFGGTIPPLIALLLGIAARRGSTTRYDVNSVGMPYRSPSIRI